MRGVRCVKGVKGVRDVRVVRGERGIRRERAILRNTVFAQKYSVHSIRESRVGVPGA